MKHQHIFLLILLFLCPSMYVSACSNSDKVKYQSLAKNITSTYEYIEETGKFNIKFTNVSDIFYIRELTTQKNYEYTGSEMVITDFNPGNSYKFGFYTEGLGCANVNMYTIYVTLPYYNSYYQDALCSGIENYKYCKKFINKQLSYDEFESYIKDYKNSLNKQNEIIDDSEEENLYGQILDIYLNYYYIILPAIIILCLLIRWYYNKKKDLF